MKMHTQTSNLELPDPIDFYPPAELIETMLSKIDRVTMLPDIAVKALEMVKNQDTSIQSFADLIQQDFKLATDVLSMANSVMYSPGRTTASLPQAIARLGFTQCKNLVIASSIGSAMNEMDLEHEWTRDLLWKHSMITGMIAVNLNRTLKLGFAGEEFASGLVHDFGRLLIASAFPKNWTTIDAMDFDESPGILELENQLIGSNHSNIGAWFATQQGLPEVLCEVIRFHHAPEKCTNDLRLVALTTTADHMANHYHRHEETLDYDPSANPGPPFLEQSGINNACKDFQRIAMEAIASGVAAANEVISK